MGPLTERLVQALVEDAESLRTAPPTDFAHLSWICSPPPSPVCSGPLGWPDAACGNGVEGSPNRALVKSLNLGNMGALEKRIRKELEEQGLLSPADGADDDAGDEDADDAEEEEEEVGYMSRKEG